MLKERLNQNKEEKKPFILYSKPNKEELVGVFQNNSNHYKTQTYLEKGFVFAPFHGDTATLIPLEFSEVLVEKHQPSQPIYAKAEEVVARDKEVQKAFEDLVVRGMNAIEKGAFEKVVLSRKEKQSFSAPDLFDLFKSLKDNYPTAYCSLFYHPEIGVWMGATPEQLLRVNDDRISTMALAGTQKNLEQQDVVWGLKEQEEQYYVTQFIVDSLQPFTTNLEVSKPYTARAAKVMHICTDIQGILKEHVGLKPILQAIHPTPAVCGMPKEASRDFILREEGYDRAYYAGFLGNLNWDFERQAASQTDLFVNLRCMEVEQNAVNLFVGCGITKDSIPFDEFVETENKSTTMKKILN